MKPNKRWQMLVFVAVSAAAGGALVYLMPERARTLAASEVEFGNLRPPEPAAAAYNGELHERFQQAAAMLHAGKYEFALTALERVIALAPRMPEAHVNAGFALLQLNRPTLAERHFRTAIDLRPSQANAYYGLALVREAAGDYAGALGAMRTFAHLSPPDTPHLRRARAAIWEWLSRREADGGPEPQGRGDAGEAGGGVNS